MRKNNERKSERIKKKKKKKKKKEGGEGVFACRRGEKILWEDSCSCALQSSVQCRF